MDLVLAPEDRCPLEQMLRQVTLSQAIARRVRVVLSLADALADAPRTGRGHGISAVPEAKIVCLTLQTKPPAPLTHWSSRRLAAKLGVAHTTVTTVRKRHGLND